MLLLWLFRLPTTSRSVGTADPVGSQLLLVLLCFLACTTSGFTTSWSFSISPSSSSRGVRPATTASFTTLFSSTDDDDDEEYEYEDTDDDDSVPPVTNEKIDQIKAKLVRCCDRTPKPSNDEVRGLVRDLEDTAEQVGIGQASSISGLLSGEWELLYAPQDVTRSSPFFWAFEKAFPDSSDQIFSITDAIPAPIKEVGPAFQHIEFDATAQTGRFVSKVKVATLGGMATSIMTTRASIIGTDSTIDCIRLQIETTKPEKSTMISKLFGPLGDVINENAPPFPSGQALERVQPGSSEVVIRTTFCDEGLRISRNAEKIDDDGDVFIFRRRDFASYDFL